MLNRLFIINGSPRKKGNTSNLIKWVASAAIEKGAHVEIIDAVKLAKENNGCRGCRQCNISEDYTCVIKDDTSLTVARMLKSNVVIFATPVYFGSFPGQLKQFIDRMYCLKKIHQNGFSISPALKDVSIALIAVSGAGEEFGLNFLSSHMRAIFSGLDKDIEELLIPSCPPEIDKIKSNTRIKKKALAFGKMLAEKID